MRAPEFWTADTTPARLLAAGLAPLGALYGAVSRATRATPRRASIPVICVGNLTLGGAGKTPVALSVAAALSARNMRPAFLTRGYGGTERGPALVDPSRDAAAFGDEAMLLAGRGPTIVARDRASGAGLAAQQGMTVVVMDDGHQNFSLEKDLSIVVVDAETGFGNGRLFPAGPLREPVIAGLRRADAVVLMGDGDPLLPFSGPVGARLNMLHREPVSRS